MTQSYTLFFSSYQNDQSSFKRVDFKETEGNNMLQDIPCSFSPSEKSVQKILNFSKSYEVLHSKLTSNIEVIKN